MADWLGTPLIITAVLAVGSVLVVIGIWVGKISEFKSGAKGILLTIQEDIKKIFERLPPTPVSGNSPRTLTEFGRKISDHFGAEEWADQLTSKIVKDIRGMEPFEIDHFCQEYVQKKLTEEQIMRVYESAYELEIDKEGVLDVLSVVLRDKLLPLAKDP